MKAMKWEHGYRVHGYWAGSVTRWGWVGLPPGKVSENGPLPYTWAFDPPDYIKQSNYQEGKARTLRQAKREVERAFREFMDRITDEHIERMRKELRRAAAWK